MLPWPDENGEDLWGYPYRLWPEPQKHYWNLPPRVRGSLEEADLCLNAKAYDACAVMCGRAVEAICSHYEVKAKTLQKGLKELLEKGVIDKKIHDWSEALRIHRNIGAHPNEEKISEEEAKDLFDFTNAICDYVFVLTKKFEEFMKRKDKKAEKKKKEKPD